MVKKKKIKIKFIQDFGGAKKGLVSFMKENDAKKYIKEKIIEYVDEKREVEAKYYRDKSVLETGKNNQLSKEGSKMYLGVKEENYEKIVEKKYALNDVHRIYKENLYIEDTKRIDIVLATSLSIKMNGIPLWLILVGSSGDMKSVQLNALGGFKTFYIQKVTSKTLVNGFKDKKVHPDLAPLLNNKLVVIRDMATLMKLPPSEKAEIWGQLRDLYDGFAGTTSGMGTFIEYKDLKITLIAGSTPAIDNQILIHQDLGTRELIYRVNGNKKQEKAMMKCMENEAIERRITQNLNEVTTKFLELCPIREINISEQTTQELMKMAFYIRHMRASATIDSYTNTLINDVYPEEPTRIIKQLKRLYKCLMSLDKDYSSKRALEILWHVSKSSAFQNRVKILNVLINTMEEKLSTSQIADILKIGKGTTQRELNILWNMNFVNCEKKPINYNDRTYDYWNLNKKNHELNKLLETFISYGNRHHLSY